MQNSLYVALSAQVALQRRLETIANNVANMNTPGYRADGVTFSAELQRAGDTNLSYVSPGDNFISRRAGPLVRTENPLDLAIQGQGFIAIQSNGATVYTRDARLKVSETGSLQNINGESVLDAGGAPIQLDPTQGPPTISGDGMINQKGRQVGAIGLFTLPDTAKLTRAGSSGFTTDQPGVPVLDFTRDNIVQGAIEGANVDPIMEMTKLIEVTRTFDSVANELNTSESSVQDAIKALGSAA